MKWTEEKILEFLELFKMEPCLWDPKEPTSKKKSIVDEAWREIIETLSYKVSQHELKRKTAHLLGYYRNHLSKLKKHAKIGLPYATDWFAFDKMDSFLRSVYESTAIKDVSPEPDNSDNDNDTLIDSILNSPNSIINQTTFDQQDQFPITNETYEQLLMDNNNRYKRKSSDDGEHIQSTSSISSTGSSCKNNQKKEELDEYDHFACLLATKIRRIRSEEDREMLMNSIQNLAFEYYVKNNHKNDSSVQPPTSTVNIQPINNQCHEFENFLL